MQRLLEFIKQIYVVLIFVVVEGVALWYYATSTPYTEAKILSRTSAVGGAISGMVTDVHHFFTLPEKNRELTERVAYLEEVLASRVDDDGIDVDSLSRMMNARTELVYRYYPARVVSSTSSKLRNYIVIDRGEDDGIAANMGVITPDRALVGYVVSCSPRYSVVMPILNEKFRIGGCLSENNYTGSVRWTGASTHHAELMDLSTYADPELGMAVEVRSERLPEGILIGHIDDYEYNATQTAFKVRLHLAVDISRLDNVIVVENSHYGEIEGLLESVD